MLGSGSSRPKTLCRIRAGRWTKRERPRLPPRPAKRPGSSNRWRARSGRLKASELSDRLARERDFAQAIARAERELGETLERQAGAARQRATRRARLAGRQRELADDTAALADVLEQLKAAARLDDRELAQSIARAEIASPPRDIEQSMRENAGAIGSGETEQAARAAAVAAGRLEALAQDLESARRAAAGPKLERLLAAEKEAAALQDRLAQGSAAIAAGRSRAGA